MPVGAPKPIRVQGCYASDEEIEGVTHYIKKAYSAQYNSEIEEKIKRIAAEEIAQGKNRVIQIHHLTKVLILTAKWKRQSSA